MPEETLEIGDLNKVLWWKLKKLSIKNISYGCGILEESREHLSMQVNAAVANFISRAVIKMKIL